MKAGETSLRNLLEGTKQFQIPLFQRAYSWKKENWKMLWDDLLMIYEDPNEDNFFMGSIVTQSIPGTAEGISPFIVIDGQQRLTTLTILLAAIRYSLDKKEPLKEEIYEMHLINKYQESNNFYKLLPTQVDLESYINIIQLTDIDRILKEDREDRISEVFRFFHKNIKQKSNIDFRKLKNVILEKLFFVNITSDEKDNPYLIFESLNYKGQELTQADLVRNYIFMNLDPNNREKIYNETWLSIQDQFANKLDNNQEKVSKELTNALWFYMRKDGKSITDKNIYREFQNSFITKDKDINVEIKLKEIIKFLKYYLLLSFPDENNSEITYYLKRFKILDFKTVHIFLLNVYDDYENHNLSISEFCQVLQYLESYFVRRWLLDIPTRSLGAIFNKLYSQVMENNGDSFVANLYKVLNNFQEKDRWPQDEEFKKAIMQRSIPIKNNRDRVKLILTTIEKYITKERVVPDNLTIEHIMPQTLNPEWEIKLGDNFSKLHDQFIHNLGNLTLTAYNSELSNKDFLEKLEYFNSSNLSLNQYFRNNKIDLWNGDTIQERAKYLADIAIKIWPR